MTEQGTEHGLPGDVVERADGVDRQHGCTRIELRSGSQHPSKGFGASSRAQAKLVRETGMLEVWPKRLGQCAADQAPKDIADDEGVDPASVGFLQRGDPADAQSSQNGRREVGTCKAAGGAVQKLGITFVVEKDTQMLVGGP